VNRGERIAARHYRLRGYRILGANVRSGGYELDLIARRGRRLVFVEVKERARDLFGGGIGAVNAEKRRRCGARPPRGSRRIPRPPRSRSASRLPP